MQNAGCGLIRDMTDLAVMGVFGVIKRLPTFWNLLTQVRQTLREAKPDAVVLIDYPGLNWHVARAAKALGTPVYYYGAPQMWAWASWRIRKMRRLVDHVLCKLPFEQQWYQQRGCKATYVGHPYFDELNRQTLDSSFLQTLEPCAERLVTILPGSRRQELLDNLPAFAQTAKLIHRTSPDVQFAVACLNTRHAELAREILGRCDAVLPVYAERTAELIRAARLCLACSGSVSLELLHHRKPSVIHYHVSRWKYALLSRLVQVKYVTLVNLLAMPDRFDQGGYDPQAPWRRSDSLSRVPDLSGQDRADGAACARLG